MRCLRLRGVRHLLRVLDRQQASKPECKVYLSDSQACVLNLLITVVDKAPGNEIISCAPYSLIKVSSWMHPIPSLSSQWLTGLTILGLFVSQRCLATWCKASEATLDPSMYHNPTLGFQALLPFGLSSQHFLFTTCSGQLVMQLINTSTYFIFSSTKEKY